MNTVVNEPPVPSQRFTKIGADGSVLPREATEWEAVLDNRTGLMWALKPSKVSNGKPVTVEKAATKCRAGGFDDYRAPTVEELFALADRTKYSPAIDTEYFPDTPSDWFWSSTPAAASPGGCAWYVFFDDGYTNWSLHYGNGFVRAVRVGQ